MIINNITIHGDNVNGDKFSGDKTVRPNEWKQFVRNLISSGKIEAAIVHFQNWAQEQCDNDLSNTLTHLKGQFISLKRNESLGLISYSEASTIRNRIVHGVLTSLDSIAISTPVITESISQQSKTIEMFPITELRRFLIDYDKGVHLKSSATFALIFSWMERAIAELTRTFPENTDDFDEFVIPMRTKLRKAKNAMTEKGIIDLLNDLHQFAEDFSDHVEESSKMGTREELVFAIKQATRDTVIEAIQALIDYRLKHELVGDKAKQIEKQWKNEKAQYKGISSVVMKAKRANELKTTWGN